MSIEYNNKIEKMRRLIRSKGAVVVAFSGGVDSSVIAKIAFDELGNKAVAVTVNSESFPKRDLEITRNIAGEIGIEHIIVKHSDLKNKKFVTNPTDRCYFCKKEEMEVMKRVAREKGFSSIAFGVNISDFGEYRPGTQALREERFFEPLVEAGIGKDSIPLLAKSLGLSNFNLPSTTCLASRIPYGEKITKEKLKRIEDGETFLYSLGVSQVRVRNHRDMARIEVSDSDIDKVVLNRREIVARFKKLGFLYVSLDLKGYRSGSMNEVLHE